MAQKLAEPDSSLRVPWPELQKRVRSTWQQGQHFTVIAPTGGGKSVMAVKGLLPMWSYTLTFDAKGEDPVLRTSGKKTARYPNWVQRQRDERFWLALPPKRAAAAPIAFDALKRVFDAKGWVVYLDELRLFLDKLYLSKYDPRLPGMVEELWLYGRSRKITLIAGTQAPRWISSAAYEQPTRFLIGRTESKGALERMEVINGPVETIRRIVPTLDKFEFLYVGPEGLAITRYPLKGSKKVSSDAQ